jgi:hypothetical protein
MHFGPLAACLAVLTLSLQASAQCLKYDAPGVKLRGVIHSKEFYGPPGYGESPDVDAREKQAMLVLDQPLCVAASADQDAALAQHEVTLVPALGESLTSYAGAHVLVTGTLFHAHTGHHHTEVLVQLDGLPRRLGQ